MGASFKGKILLTGAAGKLGKALRQLDAARFGAEVEWVPMDVVTNDDSTIREGDFNDEALIEELLPGCAAVIHTAALHGRFRKTHTPAQFTDANVTGLVKLLEGCRKHGVGRFVFSSTMEVQIGRDWMASGMAVLDEHSTPRPDWIYPANKLVGEHLGEYYHAVHGIEFAALRYMNFEKSTVLGIGMIARSIVVHDVATANLLAAIKPNLGYEVFNIGPDTPLTNQDIVAALDDPYGVIDRHWPGGAEVLRAHDIKIERDDFWPVTRIDKAKRLLGWHPEYTFEKYLRELGWQPPQ